MFSYKNSIRSIGRTHYLHLSSPYSTRSHSCSLPYTLLLCIPSKRAMAQCLSEDFEYKVSAKRLWFGCFKDAHNCLPKCMPEKIECVEYPEGHAGEAGCVRNIKFHKAHAAHFRQKHHREVLHIKEKIEEVDNESLKIKINVIEGGLLGILFNHYKYTFEFKEGHRKDTCVVHWSIEYEAIGHQQQCLDEAKEGITSTLKAVEAYLLTHNDYA